MKLTLAVIVLALSMITLTAQTIPSKAEIKEAIKFSVK